MKKPAIIALLVLFAFISWQQFAVISSSTLSLFSFLVLLFDDSSFAGPLWRSDLVEYWFAALVWLLTAFWLIRNLATSQGKKGVDSLPVKGLAFSATRTRLLGGCILAAVAYASAVCPFLVPVGPHVQGDLVTTRLLPPWSAGVVTRPIESGAGNEATSGIERIYRRANHLLLENPVVLKRTADAGIRERGSPGTYPEESSFVFLLGTDDLGRDVWSRVIYGTRISLLIGVLAAIGAVFIGSSVGFIAGMSGRFVDLVLMRTTDLFLAIPGLFLVVALMAFAGESVFTIILALAVTGWMGIARLIRGEVVRLREAEYILAARMLQVSTMRIIVRHLLPNIRFIVVTAWVLQFGNAVLAEAALSFLGLGVQPPTASWGNMMGEAMGYLGSGWWVGFFPGFLLATVIVSAHLAGEPEYVPLSRHSSKTSLE